MRLGRTLALAVLMTVIPVASAGATTWAEYRHDHAAWIERGDPGGPYLGAVTPAWQAARAEWTAAVRLRTARWYHRWEDVRAAELAAVPIIAGGAFSGAPDWYAIAACESGGRWDINTGNGYWGGLQFAPSTWFAYGGGPFDGTGPFPYSASEQIAVAENVLAAQGPGAWPNCWRSR